MQNQGGGWPPNPDPYAPVGQPPGGSFGSPGYGGYGAPIQNVYPAPSYGGSASGQAVTAIVLAVLSWMACGCFTGLPAFFLARSELGSIERGESSPAGKSMAQAAYWISLINMILMGIILLVYAIAFLAFIPH